MLLSESTSYVSSFSARLECSTGTGKQLAKKWIWRPAGGDNFNSHSGKLLILILLNIINS